MAKYCFIEVVGRRLSHEDGTGDNPRTWETVFTKKDLLSLLKGIRRQGFVNIVLIMLWLVYICTHANTYMHAFIYTHIHSLTHMYDVNTCKRTHNVCSCHLPLYLCVEEIQLTLVECGGTYIEMKYLSTAKEWQRTKYVFGRWLSHKYGTSDSPHTWETVFMEKELLRLLKKTKSLVTNLYWTTCVGEMK